jgi:4-amino-4-deoxy-L-arabinose transferase-like glycosyltransferase
MMRRWCGLAVTRSVRGAEVGGHDPGKQVSGRSLLLVFALGLVVRSAVVAVDPGFLPIGDAAEYQRIATNVLRGAGFDSGSPGDPDWHPKSWRTPGYPLFVAAHFGLFGPSRRPIQVTQVFLDAATALLVVVLGRRLFPARIAWLAGLAYALHPLPAIQVAAIGTEALAVFLLTSFLILTYRAAERPTIGRGAVAGFVFGLDLLVRPTPQLFLPFAMAFVLLPTLSGVRATRAAPSASPPASPPLLRRATAALALCLACFLVITPWAVRNYRVHHAFVPLSTLGGVVLNEGVGGLRVGDWWSMTGLRSIPAADWACWRELGEVAGEEYMRERAVEVIREHPGLYALSVGPKLTRFWLQVSAGYGRVSWRSWAVFWVQGAMLALVALAFLRYRGPWVAAGRLLWLLVLYHSALYSLTVTEARYSYVLLPCMLLPAAYALARLVPAVDRLAAAGSGAPGTFDP